ncbi:MAG: hypothetical protein GVY25_11130, partial [Bacteroidetes bacterium]|nr:hypothetical protein [Bacteroidota bacterium]
TAAVGASRGASTSSFLLDDPSQRSSALLLMSVPRIIRRLPGLSDRQGETYPGWAVEYLRWLAWQDEVPGAATTETFLRRMRTRGVSEDAILAAREALTFLHDVVLRVPSRRPSVPAYKDEWSRDAREVVLRQLDGPYQLMARLIFEAGLSPEEAAHLRTGDVHLQPAMGGDAELVVRDVRGRCDRIVPISAELADALRVQLSRVRTLHRNDREAGHGWAPVPPNVEAHFPGTGDGWEWQFVFPHDRREMNPANGREERGTVGSRHVVATMEAVLHAETRAIRVDG